MSLRAYAKLRGVSPEAVSKAITTGRLSKSVATVAGKPKIADPELADREWSANTQQRVDQPAAAPRDPPEYLAHRTAREGAAARRELAQAQLAELELAERKGEFIRIEDARRDVMEKFTLVRTKLLGIPVRLAQRMPEISGDLVTVLDELLREALEELAEGDPSEPSVDDEPDLEQIEPSLPAAAPLAEVEVDDLGVEVE
jgi:phage terminase Nu1 subunit (DNA packaging protein)